MRSDATQREAVRSAYHRQGGNESGGQGSSGSGGSKSEDATEVMIASAEDMKCHARFTGFWTATTSRRRSDDDVVRSRLRTIGVQEYELVMEKWADSPDDEGVAGMNDLRRRWVPDLASLRVCALVHSCLLWKGIVQSKLLANCIIIIRASVRRTLAAQGTLREHEPDLHPKFRDQQRGYSQQPGRPFYGYVTTAIASGRLGHEGDGIDFGLGARADHHSLGSARGSSTVRVFNLSEPQWTGRQPLGVSYSKGMMGQSTCVRSLLGVSTSRARPRIKRCGYGGPRTECATTFTEHEAAVTHIVISSDGRILASGAEDGTVCVRNMVEIVFDAGEIKR
ncbi:hypothetical protein C8Q80DRAFT_1272030 [Daedaleopsis nitida]|nr:hypothetical protein C8Q80DRAFT_1272030 [Daedaleopsis nitida]